MPDVAPGAAPEGTALAPRGGPPSRLTAARSLDPLLMFPTAAATTLALSALIICVAGTRLARVSDRLADASGMGEATFGALLLGGGTSIPGLVVSVTAAAEGHPALAVSNAIGGIAAQTAFLPLADIAYRRANLEHAAASLENLMNGVLLVVLLSVVLLAAVAPWTPTSAVHPASVVLLLAYVAGLRMSARAGRAPLWTPKHTDATRPDHPDPAALADGAAGASWRDFVVLLAVVGVAGYLVAESGIALASSTGLSETVVGALLTGVVTSSPELVTCIAAARQGSPTLAVADVIGGNTFDVLFIAVADVAYLQGPIYQAVSAREVWLVALTLLMTGVLLLGMLRRQTRGFANIGFESALVLLLYALGAGLLVLH